LGQDQTARQDEPTADEAVYDALYAALASTPRGRTFLDEVARRARNADTLAALAALARIEARLSDKLGDKLTDRIIAPQAASEPPAATMSHIDEEPFAEIPSDEAFVPFELDEAAAPDGEREPMPATQAKPEQRTSSADLLTQVMAMSPEERIALFS